MASGPNSLSGGTRYPILLVPGMLGFVRLLGCFPYWFGVVPALRRAGFTATAVMVSSVHSSEVRGEQLLAIVEKVLAETGAARVNLIGHSQGALTARHVAARRPDLVASVTSVAGPNHGSELADYLQRHYPDHSVRGRLVGALVRALAQVLAVLDTGYRGPRLPISSVASHQSLTREGVARFNLAYPQGLPTEWGGQGPDEVNGVRYYSWSGVLQRAGTDRGRNRLDGTHLSCKLFAKTFTQEAESSDGMVGRFSSHLGRVIADDYPLDHLDIVNQTFGLVGKGVDPLRLFVEHAQRLADAGL